MTLLNHVIFQVTVGFRELRQLRFKIHSRLRHLEVTDTAPHVSLNISDPVNLFQIAPDRGGTFPSNHVGNAETHEHNLR